MTGRDHVQNRKYVMRMRNRKIRNIPSGTFSPEVTWVTGSDHVRMHNRYILHYYSSSTNTWLPKGWKGVRMPNRKLRNIPMWDIFTGSWLQEMTSISRAFFLVVVPNVGWGCSLRRPRLPWLSAPFIFIITYKVCCFRICCVVLQGWYF